MLYKNPIAPQVSNSPTFSPVIEKRMGNRGACWSESCQVDWSLILRGRSILPKTQVSMTINNTAAFPETPGLLTDEKG